MGKRLRTHLTPPLTSQCQSLTLPWPLTLALGSCTGWETAVVAQVAGLLTPTQGGLH